MNARFLNSPKTTVRTPARNPLRNQGGQMIVEAVLIMTVLLAVTGLVSSFMKQSQFAAKLTSQPWQTLAGMIECGTWANCRSTPGLHPSTRNRNLSLNTEEK